ncbi:MAG: DUF6524 family protein [Gammaproteobacteria bacterium]|nr:DUF6524 family protein [Gammaproteobacteria bacterium]
MADKKKETTNDISALGFLLRFLAALALVLLTYNPSGHSAFHWITSAIGAREFGPIYLLLIGVLLVGWSIFWIATWRALGTLGVTLAVIVFGAIIWLFYDIGLLQSKSVSAITWISLIGLAAVLAIGVSWSHVWRRITGQINVEDVDD